MYNNFYNSTTQTLEKHIYRSVIHDKYFIKNTEKFIRPIRAFLHLQ